MADERTTGTARVKRGLAEMLRGGVIMDVVDAEQAIYESSLRAEVDFCIRAGVDGLVVPALASEFMVLTPEERRRVVAVVVDQAQGRVPVVANVAAASAQEAVSYTAHAREVGAALHAAHAGALPRLMDEAPAVAGGAGVP